MADPLAGRTIAQYEIQTRIGGGAMGVVYKARDTKLGRDVALKFLPQQWSHDENAKQRFLREAQTASATNHPNICTIHDLEATDEGQLFIVMAYYEGQTLKQRIEAGPMSIDEALDVATQAADGLAKAHAQGIVHRDIKPGNLILTEDGVVIVDFGLATFADALKLTTENAPLGTPAYMSPEQVRGHAADARADVWALGVVLYEMLAGHVPFQGSHAEAIAHAVRHEPAEPLRSIRPEVSEAVEQLVFRAMHKDPVVRFQYGRDLAGALREVRGLSVPMELRTQPVPVSRQVYTSAGTRRTRKIWAAASAALAVSAAVLWLVWPGERERVAIAPVVNASGHPEMNAYLLALTAELASHLENVESIRVVPHHRLLQIIRPFRQEDGEVTSREALQAIARHSGARLLIVPSVHYKDGGWNLHAEIRNPTTGTNQDVYETASEKSSLMKDAVYGQVGSLSAGIAERLTSNGLRGWLPSGVRRWWTRSAVSHPIRFRTLDAAMLFERGIDAYEQLELAAASSAFAAAAGQDPRNPVPLLWRGRMAALMRQDQDALHAADQAERLVTDETRARDRVLIEAVHAELRRDLTSAAERYQRMVARYPDEPSWLLELAAFHDRRGASAEAVETYHRALSLDSRLLTAHLELCRLYSPSALNEPALAKEHGELMLKMSRELRNRGGEAQALMCLTDVLRTGRQDEIKEARRSAEEALGIMEALKYPFGTARASNYVAIVALLAERDATRATPLLERTLTAARSVGFVFLESRVRMNLGVADEMLGRRLSAWKNFKASFALAEALGNQQGAAWSQINAAQMVIDYGGEPRDALRDAQNALGVFQQLHDKDFEVHARRVIASYHRHRGEFEDAERHLTLGLDVARQRDLDEKVTRLTLELARVRFDQGHYTQARELIEQASKRATGLDSINANLQLARVLIRLGDFSSARARLDGVEAQIKRSGDSSLPPVFLARGELEYEMGRIPQAREQFRQASALWTGDEFPDDATVEARAYHGFLEGVEGEPARGVSTLVESLTQGRKSERLTLEARCLVFLARVVLNRGNAAEAARRLREITEDRRARLSPELQAQIRYWLGQALAKQGDANAAAGEIAGARALNDAWRQSLGSPEYQASVLLRPDIRLIQSDGAAVRP